MQRPDAVLPSQLLQVIRNGDPPELATILDMAYTASVVRKEGDSFEFRIKIHPDNQKLPFLEPTHYLHKCYELMKKNEDGVLTEVLRRFAPDSIKRLFPDHPNPQKAETEEHSSNSETQRPHQTHGEATQSPHNSVLVEGYSDSE